MNKSFDEIVEEMLTVLAETRLKDDETYNEFMNTKRSELAIYHHSLGQGIRNDYGLWEVKWEPYLIDGVDHSPNHPDAISGRIIEAIWDRAHERNLIK